MVFFSLSCVFHNCDSEALNSVNQKEKQVRLFSMVLNALEATVIFFISFESSILNTSWKHIKIDPVCQIISVF